MNQPTHHLIATYLTNFAAWYYEKVRYEKMRSVENPFKFGNIVEEQLGLDIPHQATARRGD